MSADVIDLDDAREARAERRSFLIFALALCVTAALCYFAREQ